MNLHAIAKPVSQHQHVFSLCLTNKPRNTLTFPLRMSTIASHCRSSGNSFPSILFHSPAWEAAQNSSCWCFNWRAVSYLWQWNYSENIYWEQKRGNVRFTPCPDGVEACCIVHTSYIPRMEDIVKLSSSKATLTDLPGFSPLKPHDYNSVHRPNLSTYDATNHKRVYIPVVSVNCEPGRTFQTIGRTSYVSTLDTPHHVHTPPFRYTQIPVLATSHWYSSPPLASI